MKMKILCFFFVAFAFQFAAGEAVASANDIGVAVDAIFHRFTVGHRPGCEVSVAKDGRTLAERGYGWADLEHDVPVVPQSIFEAGSVSKQFTAAAVLLLARDGKLSLQDDVHKLLPELPDYGTTITIDNLLTHTSGLRDWGSVAEIAGWPRTTRVYTQADVLDIASRQTSLNHRPGAAFAYTNTGYNLLAIIVERVSGETFPAFTQERLFKPLGMTNTSWRADFRAVVPGRAIAYEGGPSRWLQNMPFEDTFGNSALLTTTHDLLIWNAALTGGKLGRGLTEELEHRTVLNDGRPVHYGRGLFLESYRGAMEISHAGSTAGYRAWLGRFPKQNLSVAILCNADGSHTTTLAHEIADLFISSSSSEANSSSEAKPEAAGQSSIEGREGLYVSNWTGMPLKVERVGEDLRVHGTRLIPFGASRWRSEDSELEFGDPGSLEVLGAWGNLTPYHRVAPVTAAHLDLNAYTGAYVSNEADAEYHVINEKGLVVKVARRPISLPLTPVYRDAFMAGDVLVRFYRNGSGDVTSLGVTTSRVWDMRFSRRRPAP